MKVLMINGSPHKNGCTYTALAEVQKGLAASGVESVIYWLGQRPISGCVACGGCAKLGKCVIEDMVNDCAARLGEFDGFVFGTPVHYASACGALVSFMDRLFCSADKTKLIHKPAAAVVSARRGGTTATFDQINKYFTMNEMPIVSSKYWNMVHGKVPADVMRDEEGLQTMRILGKNMAYLIKCMYAGRQAGINPPAPEKKISTNFIS